MDSISHPWDNHPMFNVCPQCGEYSVEKTVVPLEGSRALAVCPRCGGETPFLRLPHFMISGASGTGKSTLALRMAQEDFSCVHLEGDILWMAEFNRPEEDYRTYREVWLRMAKNIGQGGRPVAWYGSVVPEQIEPCVERRYFSNVYYLALVCEPDVLAERLRARPGWRNAGSEEFVGGMLAFNQWFLDHAGEGDPPLEVLDTSHATIDDSARTVRAWIAGKWRGV